MTRILSLIALLFATNLVIGQPNGSLDNLIVTQAGENTFALAAGNKAVDILVDQNDHITVKTVAGLFADDIERVTATKPDVKQQISGVSGNCVIAGSIQGSRFIQELIRKNKINVSEIEGQWESCLVQVVEEPFRGVKRALVVAGSDRRGTAYGLLELSKQMGVSPWYYFADVPVKKSDAVYLKAGRYIQPSPSVKYRGIFINDEVWGLRPWAMYTHAPEEGKGFGPKTYARIFELLVRLKSNILWPAMMHQNRPFNYYEENKVVADKYGIVMGSSHIEPMLRNSHEGGEWDTEYPGESWDYTTNRDHIFAFWEKRVQENGQYENVYTMGKRGQDDVAGNEITVPVLGQIIADQRSILKKWVNEDVSEVPQVLIAYTEVLDLYNKGLNLPDDVILCYPDDNFGYIRQLPNEKEQKRPGGSGVYYHYNWTNGATSAHSWVNTSPPAQTWLEMKRAYDFNNKKLWVLHAADIKFNEMGIEHFMDMAWDMSEFREPNSKEYMLNWSSEYFGAHFAREITGILKKHYELGYARRPENMVMYNGREGENVWDWFSLENYGEAEKRTEAYEKIVSETDALYERMPLELKDAFLQLVVFNVKATALHNLKVLYAQKSNAYGKEKRSSAALWAGKAQQAETEIFKLMHHYNRGQVTVKDKWDHMASMPGPWGNQWHQWDMPSLSGFSGDGFPSLKISLEGTDNKQLPIYSAFSRDDHYIDLYNPGNGAVYWELKCSNEWILPSQTSGVVYDEQRIRVNIDWERIPHGTDITGEIGFTWFTSKLDQWVDWNSLSPEKKKAFSDGTLEIKGSTGTERINLAVFNPEISPDILFEGHVESNGYISMEAEHFSNTEKGLEAEWRIIEGLGRTGHSVTVLPFTAKVFERVDEIQKYAPSLEYRMYTFSSGEFPIQFNCIPSYPLNESYGVRLAIALDDNKPEIVSEIERRDVVENLMKLTSNIIIDEPGSHTLKIYMVDPGVTLDKIIIRTGELEKSYLGPPESNFFKK